MIDNESMKELCYAVDNRGRYVLAPSAGWTPKNIANEQAWRLIHRQISDTIRKIKAGKLSPLAFHMVRHQMTPGLLAKYVGINRLRIRRHLKPSGFRRLTDELRRRYADVFDVPAHLLEAVPDHPISKAGAVHD